MRESDKEIREENSSSLKEGLEKMNVKLIDISQLKGHEQTREKRLMELKQSILDQGLNHPITVDKDTNVIIDGHHRTEIFKRLSITHIPVFYVDYFDTSIIISDENVTKEEVIAKANSGYLYPSKTTKHMYRSKQGPVHISALAPRINLKIPNLRNVLSE